MPTPMSELEIATAYQEYREKVQRPANNYEVFKAGWQARDEYVKGVREEYKRLIGGR